MADAQRALECATCNGWMWVDARSEFVRTRETVGMVCQTCGWDYSQGEPTRG